MSDPQVAIPRRAGLGPSPTPSTHPAATARPAARAGGGAWPGADGDLRLGAWGHGQGSRDLGSGCADVGLRFAVWGCDRGSGNPGSEGAVRVGARLCALSSPGARLSQAPRPGHPLTPQLARDAGRGGVWDTLGCAPRPPWSGCSSGFLWLLLVPWGLLDRVRFIHVG